MSPAAYGFFGMSVFSVGYGLAKITPQEPGWIVLCFIGTALSFVLAVYANTQEKP